MSLEQQWHIILEDLSTIMAKISLIGGDGRRSGIPRLVQLLCNVFASNHEISLFSDVNRGGYDFASQSNTRFTEIRGLASNMNPIRVFSAYWRLRRLLTQDCPDVIWVQSTVSVLLARIIFLELRLLRRAQVSLVVAYQGVPFGAGRSTLIAVPMRIFEYISLVFTPQHTLLFTSQMDRSLIPDVLVARHRVLTALNCSEFGATKDELTTVLPELESPRRIVMTTRASYQKNLDAAAELFGCLPDGYILCLVGPDTDGEEIRQSFKARLTAEKFGNVEFCGTKSDVKSFLLKADLYLMTSRYEGLPFGAIEAFECGLPIALTNVGGSAEIASAHPLFEWISVDDAEAISMAAKLVNLQLDVFRSNPKKWKALIHEAWVEHFSLPVWRGSIEHCLEETLSVGGRK